jgi:hypothetical protein
MVPEPIGRPDFTADRFGFLARGRRRPTCKPPFAIHHSPFTIHHSKEIETYEEGIGLRRRGLSTSLFFVTASRQTL